ncbi:hypothetical protein V8C35DRAFT_40906 [Trichoderma chlorosporum]
MPSIYWNKPPQFELADLNMQKSDHRYANAVKCVRAYWQQATRLTFEQRKRYLGYLDARKKEDYLSTASIQANVTSHILYTSARNYLGEFPAKDARWTDYIFLSALYEKLPADYLEAIEQRYSTSDIRDYSSEYRSYYPEPIAVLGGSAKFFKTKPSSTIDLTKCEQVSTHQQNATVTQKKANIVPISTSKKHNDALTRKKGDEVPSSTSQPLNIPSEGTQFPTASTTATGSVVSEAWNIDNVVGILSLQNNKRQSSTPESSPKRARMDGNEILEKVNQQAEIIQQAMDKLQSNQDIKLQEVCDTVEQNKQTLDNLQNELRQFMSAVATTLRNIQERLDE